MIYLKFAVGYNRRGIEETCMKNLKDNPKDSDPFPMLDRSKCFDVVASAIKDAVPESAVDLKSPEVRLNSPVLNLTCQCISLLLPRLQAGDHNEKSYSSLFSWSCCLFLEYLMDPWLLLSLFFLKTL